MTEIRSQQFSHVIRASHIIPYASANKVSALILWFNIYTLAKKNIYVVNKKRSKTSLDIGGGGGESEKLEMVEKGHSGFLQW